MAATSLQILCGRRGSARSRSLGHDRIAILGCVSEILPPIDCILISHNHYDHLDVPTLRKLARRDRPTVFCPLGLRGLLVSAGITKVYELDWYDSYQWIGLVIHCVPAQHFSSRTPFDRDRTLWCGWVLEATGNFTYFAGDTGFGKHFVDIAARFHPIQLALLPIGAYEPEWFMNPVHMTPEQAVDAQHILNAHIAIATHFGTFSLADDSMAAPTDRLRAALRNRVPQPAFLVLAEGESCHFADGSASRGEAESFLGSLDRTITKVKESD